MQQLATTFDCDPGELQHEEPAAATRSTDHGSETECAICDDTGWLRVEQEGSVRLEQYECVKEKVRAVRLAQIPERFKLSAFESYRPENPKQQRALEHMRMEQSGSYYLNGSYGSGKPHLLYAQYREVAIAGRTRPCSHHPGLG